MLYNLKTICLEDLITWHIWEMDTLKQTCFYCINSYALSCHYIYVEVAGRKLTEVLFLSEKKACTQNLPGERNIY